MCFYLSLWMRKGKCKEVNSLVQDYITREVQSRLQNHVFSLQSPGLPPALYDQVEQSGHWARVSTHWLLHGKSQKEKVKS